MTTQLLTPPVERTGTTPEQPPAAPRGFRPASRRRARIALGGVGTKPWRSPEAEAALVDQPANDANFRKAAEAAMRDAKPQSHNGFKIELARRCLAHALQMAAR